MRSILLALPLGLSLSLAVACTPELTSPDGGLVELSDYAAPENSWPMGEAPPASLAAEGFASGQVPPDMRLMDQHGDEVSLWQFYGMVVAIDFSTIWCGPCQVLAKEVDEVQHTYEDQGFIYLTVLPEDGEGQVPELEDLEYWAEIHEISAPILADDEGWSYEVVVPGKDAFPAVVVVGRDMRVHTDKVQPTQDEAIRLAIEAALAE